MVTKEKVKEVMDDVDALDLPDGAHWALVHERLGLEYGDVFDIIAAHPKFFGAVAQSPQSPPVSDEKHYYAKSGYAPYADGSGFRVTITIEQEKEGDEPTISIDSVWRLPISEWVEAARKIERMLDVVGSPKQ